MTDLDPLRDFIRRQFLYDDRDVSTDDVLFPDVIDSLGVMEVVDFLEEHYGVDLDDSELAADNFRSLGAMAQLIERKRSAARE